MERKSKTAKQPAKAIPTAKAVKTMGTKNTPLKLDASFENALAIIAKAADKPKKKAKKPNQKAD